jgi:hypothetical protein
MREKFISLISFRQGFYFTLIYSIDRNIGLGVRACIRMLSPLIRGYTTADPKEPSEDLRTRGHFSFTIELWEFPKQVGIEGRLLNNFRGSKPLKSSGDQG